MQEELLYCQITHFDCREITCSDTVKGLENNCFSTATETAARNSSVGYNTFDTDNKHWNQIHILVLSARFQSCQMPYYRSWNGHTTDKRASLMKPAVLVFGWHENTKRHLAFHWIFSVLHHSVSLEKTNRFDECGKAVRLYSQTISLKHNTEHIQS